MHIYSEPEACPISPRLTRIGTLFITRWVGTTQCRASWKWSLIEHWTCPASSTLQSCYSEQFFRLWGSPPFVSKDLPQDIWLDLLADSPESWDNDLRCRPAGSAICPIKLTALRAEFKDLPGNLNRSGRQKATGTLVPLNANNQAVIIGILIAGGRRMAGVRCRSVKGIS